MDGLRRKVGSCMLTYFWNDSWVGFFPLGVNFDRLFPISEQKRSNMVDIVFGKRWSWCEIFSIGELSLTMSKI